MGAWWSETEFAGRGKCLDGNAISRMVVFCGYAIALNVLGEMFRLRCVVCVRAQLE